MKPRAPWEAAVLRLATYNVHHGAPARGPVDLDAIVGVLAALDADVAAIQEVDVGRSRSHRVDQSRAIATALGLHVAFCDTVGGYGHAVLSRRPIEVVDEIVLDVTEGREPRRAIVCVTATPEGDELLVIGTHLENPRPLDPSPGVTDRQAARVVALLADLTDGRPGALLGDLNLDAPEVARLVAGHPHLSLAGGPATFPSRRPRHRIDHVVTSHLGIDAVEVPASRASDHRPLLVVTQ